MEEKYNEFIGVDSLYRAPVTKDDEDNYIVGAPEYLAPAGEITGSPSFNVNKTYYDNKLGNNRIIEGETELGVVVPNLPPEVAAELQGKFYNPSDGRVYDSGSPKAPDYALGFRYDMGDDNYRYYWYLKGKFVPGSEDAKSRGENIEVKTQQIKYIAVRTVHKWTIDGKLRSQKRIYADSVDPAFDATGWFAQVQTPDTSGAPDAIVLSSVLPADEAVDVAIGAEPKLTFNNPIEDEAIQIIRSSDNTVVPVTKTWNAAKTEVTLSHTSDFANDEVYQIAVLGVKDVYGQELTASVTSFTTIES